jgi:hypothetical protein
MLVLGFFHCHSSRSAGISFVSGEIPACAGMTRLGVSYNYFLFWESFLKNMSNKINGQYRVFQTKGDPNAYN